MSQQQNLFSARVVPPTRMQLIVKEPRSAVRAATATRSAAPLAGLGFGELIWIPRSKLEIGLRCVRWDDCRRCGRDTSHVFTLIALGPRTWARACLECEP